MRPGLCFPLIERLTNPALFHLEVLGGRLAPIVYELVVDHLPLVEGGQPGLLDRCYVDEDGLTAPASRRMDEAITLRRTERFNSAWRHVRLLRASPHACPHP